MTYEEVAARLEVARCDNCSIEKVRPGTHTNGWAGLPGGPKVHWRDRQVRRQGLYRFLKLVASVKLGTQAMRGGPLRTWLEATGAYDMGLILGVRFSREISAEDRTLVRSWLPTYGSDLDENTRRKIERWARP